MNFVNQTSDVNKKKAHDHQIFIANTDRYFSAINNPYEYNRTEYLEIK